MIRRLPFAFLLLVAIFSKLAPAQELYILSAKSGTTTTPNGSVSLTFSIAVLPGSTANVTGLDLRLTRTHRDHNSNPYPSQQFPVAPIVVWDSYADAILNLQAAGWEWSYSALTIDTSISHGSDPTAKFVPTTPQNSALTFTITDALPLTAIIGDRITYAVVDADSGLIGDDDVVTQFVTGQFLEVVVIAPPCDLDGSGTVDSADVRVSLRQNTGQDGTTCATGDLSQNGVCTVADTRHIVKAAAGLGCTP